LRAVTSTHGMIADYFPFPHEFLGRTATRIINEVRGINASSTTSLPNPRYDRVGVGGRVIEFVNFIKTS
jgi:hypothetical protein